MTLDEARLRVLEAFQDGAMDVEGVARLVQASAVEAEHSGFARGVRGCLIFAEESLGLDHALVGRLRWLRRIGR